MSELKTVTASLSVEMWLSCPNEECDNYIDLLDERDTDGCCHNDDGQLLRQMFPTGDSTHDDFECEDVTCSQCKTTFNVKGLEW